MKVKDIARALGLTVKQVEWALESAMKKLRTNPELRRLYKCTR